MSHVRVPAVTHLQFLVLSMLRFSPRLGRQIRHQLAKHGVRRSAPAFYQMMARLEADGLAAGEYDQKIVDGQIIKERCYTLTPTGETALKAVRDFSADTLKDSRAVRAARKRPAHA